MARAETQGWGAQVTYPNLTEASLSWALNEVLSKSSYKENVLKMAKRLTDQPQTQMDKAIFWLEYILRNEGAYYMQSSAQFLNFFQYNSLDVYALFLVIAFLVLFIPIYVIKKVTKCVCSCKKTSKQTSTRKKKN